MAIQQYSYASGILDQLRENKISEEERPRAIKYIIKDSYYAFKLLQERLYDTEEQKKLIIHKILRQPDQAYLMLTTPNCLELLSSNEVQVAIWVAIEDPSNAYHTIANVDFINEKQRQEALDVITLSRDSILEALTDINVRKEDRLYLMNKILDNQYIVKSFMKTIMETVNKNEILNDEVRKLAFDKLFASEDAGSIFWYANKNYFYYNELEIIYDKYHKQYHEMYKLRFYDYYDFCRVFNNLLEDSYRERMAKKVMTKTQWGHVNDVCKKVTFSQDIMDKIEAYKMIEQFKNAGA